MVSRRKMERRSLRACLKMGKGPSAMLLAPGHVGSFDTARFRIFRQAIIGLVPKGGACFSGGVKGRLTQVVAVEFVTNEAFVFDP